MKNRCGGHNGIVPGNDPTSPVWILKVIVIVKYLQLYQPVVITFNVFVLYRYYISVKP